MDVIALYNALLLLHQNLNDALFISPTSAKSGSTYRLHYYYGGGRYIVFWRGFPEDYMSIRTLIFNSLLESVVGTNERLRDRRIPRTLSSARPSPYLGKYVHLMLPYCKIPTVCRNHDYTTTFAIDGRSCYYNMPQNCLRRQRLYGEFSEGRLRVSG